MARNGGGGLHGSERYLVMNITNRGDSVQFAVNRSDLNMVGYLALSGSNKNKFWYFKDVSKSKLSGLFPAGASYPLHFGGSYIELERAAGQSRTHIPIGQVPSTEVVTLLCNSKNPKLIAKSLIVCRQMFCESTKFDYIMRQITETSSTTVYYPDPQMISYVQNWVALSRVLRESNGNTTLSRPIRLLEAQGQPYIVTEVTAQLAGDLSMLYGG